MIMKKKVIYLLGMLLFMQSAALASVGDWTWHGVFGTSLKKLIDTDNRVYYLSNGWLYCYDKENDENFSVSESGDLNDVSISNIYYNYDRKSLYVVYANSNIDVILDNGQVVNLPDILNSNITTSKTINHVAFSKHGTYIATAFGYVLLNDDKHEVKESRIYNASISSMCVVGNDLVIAANNRLYLEKIGNHYNSIDELTATSFKQSGNLVTIDDEHFFFESGWLYRFQVKDNDVRVISTISNNSCKNLQPIKSGDFQYNENSGKLHRINHTGTKVSTIQMPESMKSSLLSSYETDGSLWELNSNGLRHVALSDTGEETVLMDYARPNTSTVDIPFYMAYNTTSKRLYVMNCGNNRYFNDYLRLGALCSYDGMSWKDEMPDSAPTTNPYGQNNQRICAPYDFVFDPEDPNTLYVGSWFEGVYKISNGEVVAKYDWTNSPLAKVEVSATFHTCTTPCLKFDKNNNLWILQSGNTANQFVVLPRAKQSLATVTREDWLTPQVSGLVGNFRSHLFITSRDIKLHGIGDGNKPLVIFYDDGNPASSNITAKSFSTLTDQDGKEYAWRYLNCFAEDKNGKVWMGTNNGVVEFTPQNALAANKTFTVNHIKVPRNDGTNLADYLLDNTDVTCIEVDGANRKWIGTSTSGLLLVSEDGSEIIHHFTTSNSPLLSNKVISVCCNPLNNKVYIGTDKGLMEYTSDSEPAAESYSEIYAYPNPVRPEYTGDITIRGLMENSLVKIADSAGNVVRSIRSTGGMTTWDGCNHAGEPVKSGVYFIFASQNENGSPSGATTKLLIIR